MASRGAFTAGSSVDDPATQSTSTEPDPLPFAASPFAGRVGLSRDDGGVISGTARVAAVGSGTGSVLGWTGLPPCRRMFDDCVVPLVAGLGLLPVEDTAIPGGLGGKLEFVLGLRSPARPSGLRTGRTEQRRTRTRLRPSASGLSE